MSFDTTVTKVVTVLQAVSGIENVYATPLTGTRRSTLEAQRGVIAASFLQSWEVVATPIEAHEGASGYQRTRARVRVRAYWVHQDQEPDSLAAFRSKVAAAQAALMNPSTGIPQIAAPGIAPVVEADVPRRLPTGQSAWYCEFGFETLDCEHT